MSIQANEINQAIKRYFHQKELGGGQFVANSDTSYTYLSFQGQNSPKNWWSEVVLGKYSGRILYLRDVAQIKLKEQKAESYFRINGLSTIYLNIYSSKGANQLKVAKHVYQKIQSLKATFPPNYSLMASYDASKQLRQEIRTIILRSGLVLLILLLFVWVVSRSWRYLLVIGASLVANLAIAIIFYYALGIEIHLYSLASITVSLGIIIDNTIIMADHRKLHHNNKVFLAILAATLTSIGALSIIFFLKEEQQVNLIDFALVMLINLAISLFVALFFIPALMERIHLTQKHQQTNRKHKRIAATIIRFYNRFIDFSYRYKWAFILTTVWGLGIPLHWLPDKLEPEDNEQPLNHWQKTYNSTLGNPTFVNDVKPVLEKVFGGSLYLFSSYMEEQEFDWDNNRTKLTVNVSMPDGATLEQMNRVFRRGKLHFQHPL